MKSKIKRKRKKQKIDNNGQPIVGIVLASAGMAVAGGIGALLCPPAMVVLGLAAGLAGLLGGSGNGDGDGWGG